MTTKTTSKGRIKKERNADEWSVYDAAGNYMGWSQDRDEALYMAEKGYTNNLNTDEAPSVELDLWDLWNTLVDRDARVWNCGDGKQAVALPNSMMLTAKESEHGWEVEIVPLDELWDECADSENDGVCAVTVARDKYHVA